MVSKFLKMYISVLDLFVFSGCFFCVDEHGLIKKKCHKHFGVGEFFERLIILQYELTLDIVDELKKFSGDFWKSVLLQLLLR